MPICGQQFWVFWAGLLCCCCGYVCGLACMNDKPKFFVYMIMVTVGVVAIVLVFGVLCISAAASGGSCTIFIKRLSDGVLGSLGIIENK